MRHDDGALFKPSLRTPLGLMSRDNWTRRGGHFPSGSPKSWMSQNGSCSFPVENLNRSQGTKRKRSKEADSSPIIVFKHISSTESEQDPQKSSNIHAIYHSPNVRQSHMVGHLPFALPHSSLAPPRNTSGELFIAQPVVDLFQPRVGTLPFQLGERFL